MVSTQFENFRFLADFDRSGLIEFVDFELCGAKE